MINKKDYVSTQVGNPDGKDKPNKKCVFALCPCWLGNVLMMC